MVIMYVLPASSCSLSRFSSSPVVHVLALVIAYHPSVMLLLVVFCSPSHLSTFSSELSMIYCVVPQRNSKIVANTFSGFQHDSDTMTARDCISHCGSNVYAGLEYGRECWCGDYLSTLSQMLPESNCSMPCTGNANQSCGGRLT